MSNDNVTPPVPPFEPMPAVAAIHAPNLTPKESAALLAAINGVRSGVHQYSVTVTYDKIGKGKPRIAGEHYEPLPGVTNKCHTGTLVAAPTNKKGEVYLRIRDAARAPIPGATQNPDEDEAGWTAIKLIGLKSFRVLPNGVLPGPVTKIAAEAMQAAVAAVVAAASK